MGQGLQGRKRSGQLVWGYAFAVAVLMSVGYAQPVITSASSSASGLTVIAPDSLSSVYGSGLSDAIYSAAALPLPKKLGPSEVFFCAGATITPDCLSVDLLYVSPKQINFHAPAVSLNKTPTIILRVGASTASISPNGSLTSPGPIWAVGPYAPGIFVMGYDCAIDARDRDNNKNCGLTWQQTLTGQVSRGAITDAKGNVLTSSNRAKIGAAYTIWMTGIGLPVNGAYGSSLSFTLFSVPFGYGGAANYATTPLFLGPSPEFPGLDQLNFVLPLEMVYDTRPGGYGSWPCGDWDFEVGVGIIQGAFPQEQIVYANDVSIPVHVTKGDVPCK